MRRLYLKARLVLGRRRLEDARERFKNGRALIARLAEGRYYAGRWYRATGVRRDFDLDAKPDERYRLKPCYKDGAFTVIPSDDRPLSRGIVGGVEGLRGASRTVGRPKLAPVWLAAGGKPVSSRGQALVAASLGVRPRPCGVRSTRLCLPRWEPLSLRSRASAQR